MCVEQSVLSGRNCEKCHPLLTKRGGEKINAANLSSSNSRSRAVFLHPFFSRLLRSAAAVAPCLLSELVVVSGARLRRAAALNRNCLCHSTAQKKKTHTSYSHHLPHSFLTAFRSGCILLWRRLNGGYTPQIVTC